MLTRREIAKRSLWRHRFARIAKRRWKCRWRIAWQCAVAAEDSREEGESPYGAVMIEENPVNL